MLRLIIVDDERVIRETISTIIDWNSLDIELVGTCKDGIEAYDMILDEYPDIVLTDIKMPGLSGLELIKKIREIDEKMTFIILSGHEEFSFAKQAMKCGVKHYLLKPCNEKQIIEVMQEVVQDCYHTKTLQENKLFIAIDLLLEKCTSKTHFNKNLFLGELRKQLKEIDDADLLKAVLTTLLMKLCHHRFISCNPIHVTNFLIKITDTKNPRLIFDTFFNEFIDHLTLLSTAQAKPKDFIEKILSYVEEHLSDSNLSLKLIAEEYLYMNVDYLSKQFIKQTGCGNNPQYFSQLFKKYTGMSPTSYIKENKG